MVGFLIAVVLGGLLLWAVYAWLFQDRDVAPARRPSAPTRNNSVPAPRRQVSVAPPPGPQYIIEYADAYGVISVRHIVLRAVAEEDGGCYYVRAFCMLRNDDRTFRVDRILQLKTIGGAVVDDVEQHLIAAGSQIGGVRRRGGGRFLETNEEHSRVMARARSGLIALIWLASADGEVSDEEVEILFQWIDLRSKAGRSGFGTWNKDAARKHIRDSAPTIDDVRAAVGKMGKAEKVHLGQYMERMAHSDGQVSDAEIERWHAVRELVER